MSGDNNYFQIDADNDLLASFLNDQAMDSNGGEWFAFLLFYNSE